MGKALEFWLFAKDREKLDELLKRNQCDNIEWIKESIPPWKKENNND